MVEANIIHHSKIWGGAKTAFREHRHRGKEYLDTKTTFWVFLVSIRLVVY